MIESLCELGKALLSGQGKRDSFIEQVPLKNGKGEPKYLVEIDFNLDENKLLFSASKEMQEDTVYEYQNLGRDGGPNKAQWNPTTVNLNFLLVETVDQLRSKLPEGELKEKLSAVKKQYYEVFEGALAKQGFMLDLYRYGLADEPAKTFYAQLREKNQAFKKLCAYETKAIMQQLKAQSGIKADQIGLYTLLINGEPVVKHPDYQKLLDEYFNQNKPKRIKSSVKKQCCSLCGSDDAEYYYDENINLDIKYFTTNQIIFAPGLNRKNYYKSMSICSTCYDAIRAGEKYVINNLNESLCGFHVYLIPNIIFGDLEREKLIEMALKGVWKCLVDPQLPMKEMQKYVDLIQNTGVFMTVDMLFYRQSKQSTTIQRAITNIPLQRFIALKKAYNEADQWIQAYVPTVDFMEMSIKQLFYHVPMRIAQSESKNVQHFLELLDAVMHGDEVNQHRIMQDMMECYQIKWFGKKGYNVRGANKKEVVKFLGLDVLENLHYLRFLESAGVLKKEEGFRWLSEEGTDDFTPLNLSAEQTALALLGHQVKTAAKNKFREEHSEQQILEKLNFNGMSIEECINLNENLNLLISVYDDKYTGNLYKKIKVLFEEKNKSWTLSREENLFFILIGYAHPFHTGESQSTTENQ